jgi:hypothetical protein
VRDQGQAERVQSDDDRNNPEIPDDDDDPADIEADRRVLGWGGPANPNTADGQIQGITAFADAATSATGWRRTLAKLFAWGALIFIVVYVLVVFGLATRLV